MLAITAHGDSSESQVDNRFGRCEYIVFYNPENDEYNAQENSARLASGGAGISAAQFLADNDVETLITGNVGPKALQTLKAAGIKVFTGASGTVESAVKDFKDGKLTESDSATVNSHFNQ